MPAPVTDAAPAQPTEGARTTGVSSPPSKAQRTLRKARRLAKRAWRALELEKLARYRRMPVQPHVVFYESFAGNGMLCNPEAIFRELLDDPEFSHLTHVWALNSLSANPSVVREFAHHPRVTFVVMRSNGYYRALSTSGYLINNATFPAEFSKRPGQLYLNTWHGTPLKKMGYDIGDPATRAGNVIRNFLHTDFLLAANRFMTEQMYEEAYLLHQIYRGRIIEEGYPRIDRQFLDAAEVSDVRSRLTAEGLLLGDREIILYAPTWKGTNFNRPEDDADELIRRVEELRARIDPDRYVVLLKTHQVVHHYAAGVPSIREYLVPNEIPTNSILGVTDILVTDYSSIFFDFLPADKPIVFLTPDIDDYAGYRGLYLEPESWPGVLVRTVDALVEEIATIASEVSRPEVDARRRAAQQRFCLHEDGGATGRVIDIVFRGRTDGYNISQVRSDDRPKILLYAGGLRPNGITSSLVNLLDAIDHDRLDVSVIFPSSYSPLVLGSEARINRRVRRFARVGAMNGSKFSALIRRRSWHAADLGIHATHPAQMAHWDEEWIRCFGDAQFDVVVDFSGYSPFWSTLMLHAPGARRSIWLHNDLTADAKRASQAGRKLFRDLTGVFSNYPFYDHLVSVSAALAQINARELAQYGEASKFDYAPNLITVGAVLDGAARSIEVEDSDEEADGIPPWVGELSAPDDMRTFVNVGRLSSEKNQSRLIRAFGQVHATHPHTRLVIVGDGALRSELHSLVERMGLASSVWIIGHQRNPYAVMARADCFVLSSDYEGQPMVLLEALVLGLPVVTVAFESAKDALPAGDGLVVPQTDEGLAAGMRAFLDGQIVGGHFDATEYNRLALASFYRAVGLSDSFDADRS